MSNRSRRRPGVASLRHLLVLEWRSQRGGPPPALVEGPLAHHRIGPSRPSPPRSAATTIDITMVRTVGAQADNATPGLPCSVEGGQRWRSPVRLDRCGATRHSRPDVRAQCAPEALPKPQ
jgi:hypothetical protein